MSFNCFKRVNGDHLIDGHSMEDLKSDLQAVFETISVGIVK